MLYILNEKTYISDLLQKHDKPADLSVNYLINLLSKNFVKEYFDFDKFVERIKEEVSKFNIANYQEYLYAKKFKEICESVYYDEGKQIFKELDFVPIYKSDLKVLSSLSSDKYKKLLFTIIVNARYANCDGWINKKTTDDIRDIFKQSNISGGSDLRDGMLHELYKNGYVSFARSNTNQNIKYNFFEHDDEIVYKVTSFEYLGNQYIGNFKNGYMMCKRCGKIVKSTSNKKMYCKPCAEKVNREQTLERMRILRET